MMASADTPEEAREAQSMGWRTFRILTPDQKPAPAETLCRNVRTGTACQVCGLCAGHHPEGQARGDAAARQQTGPLLPERRDGEQAGLRPRIGKAQRRLRHSVT